MDTDGRLRFPLKRFLMTGAFVLSLTGEGVAGDNQARRIEQLEQENYRLVMEVSRLRQQIVEIRRAEAQRRRLSSGYSYGRSPMTEASRRMQEANQLKRNWEQLQR